MLYYIGDTHFGHSNIIRYCNRPFGNAREMDLAMAESIRRVDAAEARIVHVGDFAFRPKDVHARFGELMYPEHHTLIMGNHDRDVPSDQRLIRSWFATVVGTRADWRTTRIVIKDTLVDKPVTVMVSHLPQRSIPDGVDYHVYGHFHNNLYRQPEREADWLFVLKDSRYLNAGVEVTNYMPMTLAQLIQANKEALTRVW